MTQTNTRDREIHGGGPWVFQPDSIDAGGKYQLDLRNMTYRGQAGFFRGYLPLDVALITNQSDENDVLVRVSHENEGYVPANVQQKFDGTPISHVEIENQGGTPIEAPELTIELQSTGYGADDQARERKSMGPVRTLIREHVGL